MTCKTCNGFGYLLTAPSTCSAGGERRSCPVCAPDAAASEAGEVLAWLADRDNLILSASTTSDTWQVRRASGMIRGEGATPLAALRAALTTQGGAEG